MAQKICYTIFTCNPAYTIWGSFDTLSKLKSAIQYIIDNTDQPEKFFITLEGSGVARMTSIAEILHLRVRTPEERWND